MARRGKSDDEEEVTEGIEPEEEVSPAGAEFVPEVSRKAKSDVYSVMLILTFLVFLAGSIVAGREAWEHYDVQFYMFEKPQRATEGQAPTTGTTNTTSTTEPAPAPK